MPDKKQPIDQDLIRQLAVLLNESELSEIEVEVDDFKIRVARIHRDAALAPPAPVAPPAPAAVPAKATLAAPDSDPGRAATPEPVAHPGTLRSPMVGTAFHASEPGAEPFVTVGDTVKEGQTVLIIEAMKTMNQIHAPSAGTVTQILVENGQPVEFGEALLIIE